MAPDYSEAADPMLSLSSSSSIPDLSKVSFTAQYVVELIASFMAEIVYLNRLTSL